MDWLKKLGNMDDNNGKTIKEKVTDTKNGDKQEHSRSIIEEAIIRLLEPRNNSTDIETTKVKIIERAKNFLEEYIYPIILDDLIFSKEEQHRILKIIDKELENLETILSYPWMHKKVKIAFAGKFSSGKSSMINTLLNTDALPTDITPTTAIPTHITYIPSSEENTIYAINRDGKVVTLPANFLKEIKHTNLDGFQGKILQSLVDSLFVNYHSKLLSKVIIVDTPGYNPSSSNIDKQLSLKALKGSDLIFWIIDIEDGDISKDTMELIKREMGNKKFCIVVNKVDRKPPSARNKVKDKIIKTLKNANIHFEKIFLFSSKEKDKYLPEVLNFINKYSESKEENLPFIDTLRITVEGVISSILNLSKQDDKFFYKNLKIYTEKNVLRSVSRIINNTFEEYFYLEEPLLFGSSYYKIDKEELDEVIEEMENQILYSISEFIFNELLSHSLTKKYISVKNTKKDLEKLLELSRKSLKKLDIFQEEIENSIHKLMMGG